jgi:nucleoside-diphosphate-sugar epimerase
MKVLILGGTGYMGPHVIRSIGGRHQLLVTDVNPPKEHIEHEFRRVDASSPDEVMQAAEGMDAIINLAVVREHPRLAFNVNARGCHNMMSAAVEHGIRRVINSGPYTAIAGPSYRLFDFGIPPDIPPHPGTDLYALTKSLGQEICEIFAVYHDIYVQTYLFWALRNHGDPSLMPNTGGHGFDVSWRDTGEVFRLGLEIELERLPSRCEVFFILADMPHGGFTNEKAKRILGFKPTDDLSNWMRSRS